EAVDTSGSRFVSHVEAVKPGYINFHARWDALAEDVIDEAVKAGDRYGALDVGKDQYVLVEHTSVNPNKALHIGHARNTCLGDSLARLLTRAGYRVAVANYVDDSGTQMADILLAFSKLGYGMEPPDGVKFDDYCGRIYTEVNRRIAEDSTLEAERRRISASLEDIGSEFYRLNRSVVDRVLRDQMRTCWRLGARYDVLNRESDVIAFDLWSETFQKLQTMDAVYLAQEGAKKGCWVINLADHPVLSKEGDEVLVKSDGTTTYVARDIAYACWKLGAVLKDFKYRRWGENPDGSPVYITDVNGEEVLKFGQASSTVNVVDARQKRPQEVVKHALRKLGVDPSRYIHYAYEVVSLSRSDAAKLKVDVQDQQFVHMSGRAGVYINVDPLLDYIAEKAVEGAVKRHPDWPAEKLDEVGEKVAVAALRYFLIKSDPDKMIVFDSEQASDIEGDTGPYIQYAYARASRIIEKAEAEPLPKPYGQNLDDAEKELVKVIGLLPFVFEEAVKILSVKRVASYLRELAVSFNNFYEKCPVLTASHDVKVFRLALVEAFRSALSSAAWVAGIPLVREM
ncbi:MAG: arginine--tRNA ligase, partial [Candidatus Caldarchaeum sp.]|nr:arginine--tRNA ligase [Candidatus Caldarchaeum sp.]